MNLNLENMNEASPSQAILVHLQYPTKDDEINLLEFWRQLTSRKILIFKITAFFAVASTIAVLLWPKIWRAEILFMPPKLQSVQGLNFQENKMLLEGNAEKSESVQYTPNSVYKKFLTNYQSTNQKKLFFNKNKLSTFYNSKLPEDKKSRKIQIEKSFKVFNKALKLNMPKTEAKTVYISSTLDFVDQRLSAEFLNQYAKMVQFHTLQNILQEVEGQIKQKQTAIKEQIASKKETAKQLRNDRIIILNEAIKSAKLLDIKDDARNQNKESINKNTPLILRGYKALEVEKKVLEERKEDAPFIDGLRMLEEKNFLFNEQLKRILKENYSVVKIDQEALVPDRAIKPKGKLIVIASIILGFIFSILIVFFLNIKEKYRQKTSK